jgi:ABC-2 type transport system ATP-binding protein
MRFLPRCCELCGGAINVLEVKNLCRSFRGIPAIQNISFKVAEGEIVGFLGPNGAGKSTTVKIIIGLLRPNDGHVFFDGRDTQQDMVAFRSTYGYVPEEAQLYTYMSGLEYLQLVGRLRGLGEALIEIKATRLLRLLQLQSWQHTPISAYSKGMRQRVLLAAALLHDPKLLIFDEPLSGLDVVSSRLFKDLLELLAAQGKAILYISHVLEVVEQVCNRVIVISKGRIVADASPAELTKLMHLSNLENVFAQLVQQQDTRVLAQEMVEVMQIAHA